MVLDRWTTSLVHLKAEVSLSDKVVTVVKSGGFSQETHSKFICNGLNKFYALKLF